MAWPIGTVSTTGMDADADNLPRTDILAATQKLNELIGMDVTLTSDVAKGDALVGVKSILTGAVARTAHDKFGEIVHACDFGAKFDNSTDDTAAIQAALNAVAGAFGGGHDVGGGAGGTVICPRGTAIISSTITVPDSCRLKGSGNHSTVLKLAAGFPTTSHAFLLGSTSPSVANFDTRIEDLQIWTDLTNGIADRAIVYTNGAQHTSGLTRVKIFAGSRHAVRIETGTGGASYITFDDVETFNKYNFASNANWHIDYAGALMVRMTSIVAQGPSDSSAGASSVALHLRGGIVLINGFHCEWIKRAIYINQSTSSGLRVCLNGATGNTFVEDVVRINGQDRDTVELHGIDPNGATNAVNNMVDSETISGQLLLAYYF